MAILAVPGRQNSSQGRLVTDDGGQLGIIEAVDIRQRQVYRELHDLARQGSLPVCDGLYDIVKTGFAVDGKQPQDIKNRNSDFFRVHQYWMTQ